MVICAVTAAAVVMVKVCAKVDDVESVLYMAKG